MIPKVQNCVDDSLATFATYFKVPIHPVGRYEIEVRHKSSIPDNVKIWQAFKDDKKIHKFLTLIEEFEGLDVDEENEIL